MHPVAKIKNDIKKKSYQTASTFTKVISGKKCIGNKHHG